MTVEIKEMVREDDGDIQELVLTMTASAEEVDESADKFFKEIGQREIQGFRKGKAPREVLEQSVGGHGPAMGGVAEMLINELALEAIDRADVIFIDDPVFNVDKPVELGQPFTFTVSGPVSPLMKLTDYGPVTVEMPPAETSDKEIERALKELQDVYHSFENIDDPNHEAEMGDYVMARVTVTNDGKIISGLKNTSRLIGLGEGTMPASFDEKVIGAKAGDVLEFDFEAKNEDGTSDYGDGNLHAEVSVESFRRCILPEIDDALAVKVGCTDVEDMKKQLKHTINAQKAQEHPKMMVDRVIDAVVERLDGDVPEYYVGFFRQDVGRELMQNLEKEGTNLQQWMLQNSVDGEKMKEDVAREALRRAAIDCALEALFAEKGWEVTDADMLELFSEDEDPQETLEQWRQAHRLADVRKMCRRNKATRWLADTATVVEVDE